MSDLAGGDGTVLEFPTHQGWSLVNMMGYPAALLAREFTPCFESRTLVTDDGASLIEGTLVDQAAVFAEFAEHRVELRALLPKGIATLPADRDECECGRSLDGIDLRVDLP